MTVPLPLPLLPAVIVIQLVLLLAIHEQPLVVVTVSLTEPPPPATCGLVGDTLNPHDGAACVTVTVCPATVIVPVLDEVVVFEATV